MALSSGNMLELSASSARIFRITHIDNVPWVLDHGLYCRASGIIDPNFRTIGNPDVIDKRTRRPVPIWPGGTLNDYIPFYFTPHSPMLLNIKTGHGVPAIPMPDIAFFITSLHKLVSDSVRFLFTDRHAYLQTSSYYSDLNDLVHIDWKILQARDFKRSSNDPGKMERYQAEALVYKHLSVSSLEGIACYNIEKQGILETEIANRRLVLPVRALPDWCF